MIIIFYAYVLFGIYDCYPTSTLDSSLCNATKGMIFDSRNTPGFP